MLTSTGTGTFAEYLRPLGSQMPPQLISPAAFENIQRTAQVIPGALAMSLFGFECQLANEEPVADFQLSADAAFNARRSLSNAISSGNMLLRNHPVWQRIYDFVGIWSDQNSLLHQYIHNIWLEFDMGSASTEVPVPSLFFGLRNSNTPGYEGGLDPAKLPEVCLKALTLLKGNLLPASTARKLASAIDALPPGGNIGFVGSMLARNVNAYRLIVQGLDPQGISLYLKEIGWPGPFPEMEEALAATSRFSDYLWLNVDIGDRTYPKIGWECYYNRRAQPVDDSRWIDFLDYLVENNLCVPSKREGLLAYPRSIDANDAGSLWPESLRLLAKVLGPRALNKCGAALHHVKINFQADKPLEAKAYLCAYYQ